MNSIDLVNPRDNKAFTLNFGNFSPNRMNLLTQAKSKYVSPEDYIEQVFAMIELTPTLLENPTDEIAPLVPLLKDVLAGKVDKLTAQKALEKIFRNNAGIESINGQIEFGKEAIEIMANKDDLPKGLVIDEVFWTFQDARAVVRVSRFFRSELVKCFSAD